MLLLCLPVTNEMIHYGTTFISFEFMTIASYMPYYQRLYSLGARKIVVVNVGPIGCIPYLRDTQNLGGSGCVALANQLAQGFNTKLKDLVTDLSKNLEGSLFVYADAYRIVNNIVSNYKSYGITKILSSNFTYFCYGS